MFGVLFYGSRIGNAAFWVDEFVGTQVFAAFFALIAVGTVIPAIGAGAHDKTIGQENLLFLVKKLRAFAANQVKRIADRLVVEVHKELLRGLVMDRVGCAGIDVKGHIEFLKGILDHCMVLVYNGFGGGAFIQCFHRNGCSMFIGTADIHDVFAA